MSRQSAVHVDPCLACLLKPTYVCEQCDKVGCCEDHVDQFTMFQSKDPEDGMMLSCSSCRSKVQDSFSGHMHWSMCLRDFLTPVRR